jgi:hypothetical protein
VNNSTNWDVQAGGQGFPSWRPTQDKKRGAGVVGFRFFRAFEHFPCPLVIKITRPHRFRNVHFLFPRLLPQRLLRQHFVRKCTENARDAGMFPSAVSQARDKKWREK